MLDIIHAQPVTVDHLLIVAHNPGLEDLVLMLVPDAADDAIRAAISEKLPTGSVVELAVEGDDWAAVTTARLLRYTRPVDLDPDLAPDADGD